MPKTAKSSQVANFFYLVGPKSPWEPSDFAEISRKIRFYDDKNVLSYSNLARVILNSVFDDRRELKAKKYMYSF